MEKKKKTFYFKIMIFFFFSHPEFFLLVFNSTVCKFWVVSGNKHSFIYVVCLLTLLEFFHVATLRVHALDRPQFAVYTERYWVCTIYCIIFPSRRLETIVLAGSMVQYDLYWSMMQFIYAEYIGIRVCTRPKDLLRQRAIVQNMHINDSDALLQITGEWTTTRS